MKIKKMVVEENEDMVEIFNILGCFFKLDIDEKKSDEEKKITVAEMLQHKIYMLGGFISTLEAGGLTIPGIRKELAIIIGSEYSNAAESFKGKYKLWSGSK